MSSIISSEKSVAVRMIVGLIVSLGIQTEVFNALRKHVGR
jgi:hypothetical protein